VTKRNIGEIILTRLSRSIDLSNQLFIVDYVDSLFGLLVAIVLSQNTSDKNSIKALRNLMKETQLLPEKILSLKDEKLEELIKPGGLYKEKAKRIKELARMMVNGYSLEKILNMPVEEARRELLKIPGIGKKTADVFLAIHGKETIGVDTHAARVSKRLGIAPWDGKYEDIRRALLRVFKGQENYDIVHRYLIALGRKWCKAKDPICHECPLNDICQYYRKRKKKS